MAFDHRMAAILIFSLFWCFVQNCDVNDVAVYKVKIKTLDEGWMENVKVHWSQMFGQIHNRSYALYRVGDPLSPYLQGFIQTGNLDPLAEYGKMEPKVYDQFTVPAKEREDTEYILFLDAEHSLVSLISRIMPPNGCFIGIDSLDLCLHSSWVDEITLDLETLNANIDNVGEFPKPVEKLSDTGHEYRFKSRHQNLKHMHSIAQVEFIKIKEYSTKELNDINRKEIIKTEFKASQYKNPSSFKTDNVFKDDITTKNSLQQLEDLEEDPVGTPRSNNPENNVIIVTKSPNVLDSQSEETSNINIGLMDEAVLAIANGKKLGLGKHLPRHFRSRLHHAVNRRHGKDCIVTDWSDWSPCSDPCSIKQRVREIVQQNIGRVRPCPPLIDKELCGHCIRGDGDYIWN